MFGKVMQDAELCKELLQRILPDLEIDRIEYPEAQKSIKSAFKKIFTAPSFRKTLFSSLQIFSKV